MLFIKNVNICRVRIYQGLILSIIYTWFYRFQLLQEQLKRETKSSLYLILLVVSIQSNMLVYHN